MANSSGTKCPKCGHSSFELVEDFPSNANFKMYYIRCSSYSCRTFLQALPFKDTNHMIGKMEENLQSKIESVDRNATRNANAINTNLVNAFNKIIDLLSPKK